MTPKSEFTTFDVVKIIGIKMERLQDWMKRGFIKPTRQVPISRGLKSYFDRLQLYIIEAFYVDQFGAIFFQNEAPPHNSVGGEFLIRKVFMIGVYFDSLAEEDIAEFLQRFDDGEQLALCRRVSRLRVREFTGIECDRPVVLAYDGPQLRL